jgi:hypothetical protein
VEGPRRHGEEEARATVELHGHAQQAHLAGAGGYALRYLLLEHHDEPRRRLVGLEEVAQDGRRYVVREVSDDGVGARRSRLLQKLSRAQVEDVGADDGDVGTGLEALPQMKAELLVHFHRHHSAGARRQLAGQDAEAGPDFDDRLFWGDLGGGDDARQDMLVDQEVLSEALAGGPAARLGRGGGSHCVGVADGEKLPPAAGG